MKNQDIFDNLDDKDIFDSIDDKFIFSDYVNSDKTDVFNSEEMAYLVKQEVSKAVKSIKIPEKVIEKQIIKEVTHKDTKKYVEEKNLEALKEEVKRLKELNDEVNRQLQFLAMSHGGSGVIGLPNPDGNGGKTLQVVNGQWKPVTASTGGGSSPDAYTVLNGNTLRTFDVSNSTIDELYRFVGSLVVTLQGAGIIQ